MASENRSVIVPLNSCNYATWKIQCRMALIRDAVWNIVDGTEVAPTGSATTAEAQSKFKVRQDRALATIVLSIEPSLLYLLGDPKDPTEVWKKLEDQFHKKSWANKLTLRRKLYSLKLGEKDSVQEHIKNMTEIFEQLSFIGDTVTDEDRVVFLLASLPDSYRMLVTALEANSDVPKMEVVTERLLHEEQKQKREIETRSDTLLMTRSDPKRGKGPKCFRCRRFGHIQRNCPDLRYQEERVKPEKRYTKPKVTKRRDERVHVTSRTGRSRNRDDEDSDIGLIVTHVLSVGKSCDSIGTWVIDSGATCHICCDINQFVTMNSLPESVNITFGDGHKLTATKQGDVVIFVRTEKGRERRCVLHDVLFVPELSFNLFSVPKATERGASIIFEDTKCRIFINKTDLIAEGTKKGKLYHLMYRASTLHTSEESINTSVTEDIWHRRYGHLNSKYLKLLVRKRLVIGLNYDCSKDMKLCESCVKGKLHRNPFTSSERYTRKPLELVHTDVCGKLEASSLSGGQYFLTFIDDYSRYIWIYILKHKSEVFTRFTEWKAMVEKSTGHDLISIRSDNGGEYLSSEFQSYLKVEGIKHERTVPKNPEQNGIAERLNRTLVESVRSMLADATLPKEFWAEALSTATYLRNRSPTKALAGLTPYEVLKRKKPCVDHLRIFGCVAHAHVPSDERRKLDPKSKRCILLGYGTDVKGYRLYDVERRRVFYSRDVVFDESKVGMNKENKKDISEHQVEFPSESNDTSRSDIDEYDTPPNEVQEETNNEELNNEDNAPQIRRSERERRKPDYYGIWVNSVEEVQEPNTFEEAITSPHKDKWITAMQEEMHSLSENEVWDLVEPPNDKRIVGSKWVYKKKIGENGLIERYKARLVAQGFSQKYSQDYEETFSPLVRCESIRTVIAISAQEKLKIHQMDITTAFLNGELEEEVYMRQPEGFELKGQENLVCKLKRSIYGLRQSPRCWNFALDKKLQEMGFNQIPSDPCVYVSSEGEKVIIAIYVDDILLAGKSLKQIEKVKKMLGVHFKVKDMGELTYFLGVKVIQHEDGSIWIGQPLYTEELLKKFNMDQAKEMPTPVNTGQKLVQANEDSELVEVNLYQSAVGCLLYLATRTRPDIAYAVGNLSKFCTKPTKEHWTAVKRVMRYLKGTVGYGLLYSNECNSECVGYSDADWAGDLTDYKSTSGYVFTFGGAAVSWKSKKQESVALSTAEAEYMALSMAAQEATWMRRLLSDLRYTPSHPTVIYEDNQSTISMTKNPTFHRRTKHIGIKYHFVREQVKNEFIKIMYCPSEEMIADIFTKGLSKEKFWKFRSMMGIKNELIGCKEEKDTSICKK